MNTENRYLVMFMGTQYQVYLAECCFYREQVDNNAMEVLAGLFSTTYMVYLCAEDEEQALLKARERHAQFLSLGLYQVGKSVNYFTREVIKSADLF